MRVFMLGWEFPPFISGGLGTACYGLTKAMSALGTDVMFVLPRPVNTPFSTHVRLVSPHPGMGTAGGTPGTSTEFRLDEFDHVTFRTIDAQMTDPYQSAEEYQEELRSLQARRTATTTTSTIEPAAQPAPSGTSSGTGFGNASASGAHYAGDLFTEIQRYAALAGELARNENFDVVHAHDWMTFPAGLAVAGIKGVPLVVHVHSTEFDRSGLHIDQRIYDIERRGMHGAIKVIAVSYLTKNLITHHYGINPGQGRGRLQRHRIQQQRVRRREIHDRQG